MILSIADSRPRNQESQRTADLLPHAISQNATALIGFLEQYYEYMNSVGLPSKVIANITTEHDIDRASSDYLDAIQREIANSIPNSKMLDRVSLYKKIVKYYSIRGTAESANTFFQIFFDELIEIIYPKDYLFKTSDGSGSYSGDDWRYSNRKGFLSDQNKIQDGYVWQEYSYGIKTGISFNEWEKSYLKLVHPAGLYLFSELLILVSVSNVWDNYIDYNSTNPANDLTWLNAYISPHTLNSSSNGFHSPKFQPGWLSGNARKLRLIISALIANGAEANFIRAVYIIAQSLIVASNSSIEKIKSEYNEYIKFWDPNPLMDGYANITIEAAMANAITHVGSIRGSWYPWANSTFESDQSLTYVTPTGNITYPQAQWQLASSNHTGIPYEPDWQAAYICTSEECSTDMQLGLLPDIQPDLGIESILYEDGNIITLNDSSILLI